MATDFLSQKRKEIEDRLGELRPLHEEYLRLERAVAALEGSAPAPARRRGRGRSAASAQNGASSRRRSRGRRGGTRAEQALAAVRQSPGITVSELAAKLNITPPNYLYRVMAGLEADGAVKKQGRGFVAA